MFRSLSVRAASTVAKTTKTVKKTRRPSKKPPNETRKKDGLVPDNWGKDALAPPKKRRTRLAKEMVLVASRSSFPPHQIPYLRRIQGVISDDHRSVLRDVQSPSEHKPIAQLAHGLDRVLFNPGVYWLKDPRSRLYNFAPWLESIPRVSDFDFDRVTGFVKSSRDDDLWSIAKQHGKSFAGSTSSLTGLLSHCYFLISEDKTVDTSTLSSAFAYEPKNFTPGQRMPSSVVLNYKQGVWLVDSDKAQELAEKNVLIWMGTMLEKFLTLPEQEFKKLLRAHPLVPEQDSRREAYRYAMSDRFIMRSQLDCVDSRLPGSGVFDIKTRAAVPIRMDILNYEENSGYLIKHLTGPLESFEKEYYDLMRNAFLKYSLQARIGNMDGVLVAYHNTARIFGFQYVPLEEMEKRLHGTQGTRVFNKCVVLLERILSDVVALFGERSVQCTFETRESSGELAVWVQPAEWDENAEGKPCPITELRVFVSNLVDGTQVKGEHAVSTEGDWVVNWSLAESALPEDEARQRLEDARQRQLSALNFPSGIETMEQMEAAWAKIQFGKDAPGDVCEQDEAETTTEAFSTVQFRAPDKHIRQLRLLALQGREETLKEEREKREKVVLEDEGKS